MKAIIVAGGKGERLRPFTNTIPKPMLQIGDKPILEHIVNYFKSYGITDFIFALCYLPDVITNYFGNGRKFGATINYTFEPADKPMGTAGAILPAKPLINDTFIVAYADIVRELDLTNMIGRHKTARAIATLHVYKRKGKNPKSMVKFDKNQRITKFIERPKPTDISGDFVWSNGSLYVLEPSIFSYIPKNMPSDFGKDIFPTLVRHHILVNAYPTDDYFVDIGDEKKLNTARFREEAGEKLKDAR